MRSGAQLATSSGDACVKIWDFSKAACVLTFADHTHAVWGVSWHSCGDFLASCSMDNTSKIWDLRRWDDYIAPLEEYVWGESRICFRRGVNVKLIRVFPDRVVTKARYHFNII